MHVFMDVVLALMHVSLWDVCASKHVFVGSGDVISLAAKPGCRTTKIAKNCDMFRVLSCSLGITWHSLKISIYPTFNEL